MYLTKVVATTYENPDKECALDNWLDGEACGLIQVRLAYGAKPISV